MSRFFLTMRHARCFVAAALLCSALAFAQGQNDLSPDLVRHTFILRNFYTDQKLNYDSKGVLLSGGMPGFGPSDGRVYIKEVVLVANRLTLRGERPISIFNPGTGDTSLLGLHRKVEIDVQLPADQLATDSAPPLLDRIFLTSSETKALACSAEESRAFRQRMLRSKQLISAKKNDAGTQGDEPSQLCYPEGERAYLVGGGIDPPKPTKTPDPGYPQDPTLHHRKEIVVLALIVDAAGRPSSLIVIGPGATLFDVAAIDAVQRWRFSPASYQGKPVPAAINVEVSFRP